MPDRQHVALSEGRVSPGYAGPRISPEAAAAPFEAAQRFAGALVGLGREAIHDQARTQEREYFAGLSKQERQQQASWADRTDDTRFKVADEATTFYADKRADIERTFGWSEPARADALARLDEMEARGMHKAHAYVRQARAEQKADSFKLATGELLDFAAANTDDMGAITHRIADVTDDILASYPPERAELLARTVQDQTFAAMLVSMARKDPHAARERLAQLKDDKGNPLMSAGAIDAVTGRIDTEIRVTDAARRVREREAEARDAALRRERAADLEARIDDAMAFATATGGEPEGVDDLVAQYGSLGDQYAERAGELHERIADGREVALYLREGERDDDGHVRPMAEQFKRVEALRPASPDGAARQMRKYQAARKELEKRAKALEDDPAGAVWDTAKAEVAQVHPTEADQGKLLRLTARKARDMEERLTGRPGRLLPAALRTDMRQRFDQADAGGRLRWLQSFKQVWGDLADDAAMELDLPDVSLTALKLVSLGPTAEPDARSLLAAATAKPGDIPPMPQADLTSALDGSEVLDAMTTVAGLMPANARYQAYARSVRDTLGRAARMAGKADGALLLDRHYTAVNDSGMAVWFPKRFDPDRVADALDDMRNRLPALLAFEKHDLGTEAWETRVRDLDDNGVWINSPDGDGFVLLNPTSQKLVAGQDGRPLRVRFSAIERYADVQPDDVDLW